MIKKISFTTFKELYYKNIIIELYVDFDKIDTRNELRFRFYFSKGVIIYTTFRLDKLKVLETVNMVELLRNVLDNFKSEKSKMININVDDNYQVYGKIMNNYNRISISFNFLYYGFSDTTIFIGFEKKIQKDLLLNIFDFIIKKIQKIFENTKEQIKETIIDELNIIFTHSPF